MSSRSLVLFGGDPELMEVAIFYFREDTDYTPVAVTMDAAYLKEERFQGLPVVAFEEIETTFPPVQADLFVALSYGKVNATRRAKCEAAMRKGYQLPSYVSPRATVYSTLQHGPNCFILEDNTIQPFAKIGTGVTLWSGNHIGHHANIGDYTFVTSHVVVSGCVKIGPQSFLGVNSTINDAVVIGASCVVGSGALVAKDLPDNTVVAAEATKLSPVPSNRLRGF